MSKRGHIDFGGCLCGECPLFIKAACPRVTEDGKEMCLKFQGAKNILINSAMVSLADVLKILNKQLPPTLANEVWRDIISLPIEL